MCNALCVGHVHIWLSTPITLTFLVACLFAIIVGVVWYSVILLRYYRKWQKVPHSWIMLYSVMLSVSMLVVVPFVSLCYSVDGWKWLMRGTLPGLALLIGVLAIGTFLKSRLVSSKLVAWIADVLDI